MRYSLLSIFPSLCLLCVAPLSTHAQTAEETCAQIGQTNGAQSTICGAVSGALQTDARAPSKGPVSAEVEESHIFFTRGGTSLDEGARAQLTALVAVLNTDLMRTACLRLIGHSDSSGGRATNDALALKRATTVGDVLRAGLDDPSRVREVISAGESQPLPDLPSVSPQNRRVEIRAKTCS
ncbi:OmpA family protein [Shimia sp. NS0008-38b]|uniref:OmpA family protein n=1 Tax=Shimia sp. NS0008-38b TaxID=3127653 RepID=UPI003340FE3D